MAVKYKYEIFISESGVSPESKRFPLVWILSYFTRYLPVIVVFCIVTPVGGLEVAITGICISFPAADTAVPNGMRRVLLGA